MTAGEHSDRGSRRDDQDYPSYSGPEGAGDDGRAWSDPWSPTSQSPTPHTPTSHWSPPTEWANTQQWSARSEWPPPGTGGQVPGYGYGEAPATEHGQPAPYGEQYGQAPAAPGHSPAAYGEPEGWYAEPGGRADPYPPGGDATRSARHRSDDSGGWRRRTEPDDDSGRRGRGRRRGLPLWQELPLLLVIAFCLALLVRTFLLQAFFIPSGSMEETLLAGDRVLVNKVIYQAREPARGEVVVFRGTDAWSPQHAIDSDIGILSRVSRAIGGVIGISGPTEKDYIKRIVGLPGDRVSCCDVDGRIFVNGQPLNEDYVIFDAPLSDPPEGGHDCRSRRFDEVVVEPGQMFVLGDHRAVSQDSRCQGQVPMDNIIGRAFAIVWPSGRWTSLAAPEAFDSVPRAVDEAPAPAAPPTDAALAAPLLLATFWTFRSARRDPGATGEWHAVSSRGG